MQSAPIHLQDSRRRRANSWQHCANASKAPVGSAVSEGLLLNTCGDRTSHLFPLFVKGYQLGQQLVKGCAPEMQVQKKAQDGAKHRFCPVQFMAPPSLQPGVEGSASDVDIVETSPPGLAKVNVQSSKLQSCLGVCSSRWKCRFTAYGTHGDVTI